MVEDEEHPARAGKAPASAAEESHGGSEVAAAAPLGRTSAAAAMSGTDFQTYIGRGLRAVFDDVAKQPVPDRFLELMKKLG